MQIWLPEKVFSTVLYIYGECVCINVCFICVIFLCASVVKPQSPAYRLILRHFGQEILLDNGEIDRQKLGQIIFSNPEKRRLLNSITHPEIHKEMFKQILLYFIKGTLTHMHKTKQIMSMHESRE